MHYSYNQESMGHLGFSPFPLILDRAIKLNRNNLTPNLCLFHSTLMPTIRKKTVSKRLGVAAGELSHKNSIMTHAYDE